MNSKKLLIVVVLVSLVGCAQKPSREIITEDRQISAVPASTLLEQAKRAIELGQFRNAEPLLQQLNFSARTPVETLQYNLLALEYAIGLKHVDQSQQVLNRIDRDQINQSSTKDQVRYGLLKAQFYELSGNNLTAARERDFLSSILEGDIKAENHQQIWKDLTNISLESLLKWAKTAPNTQFADWLQLAAIAKNTSHSLTGHIAAVNEWRLAHPSHPAAIELPGGLALLAEMAQQQPKHIALLLPLTGNLANSGKAVREGFMAAYYQTLQRGYDVPTISIIDTEASGNLTLAYGDAVALEAELVIGPLDKKKVNQLAKLESLPLPTLALNYSDNIAMGEQPNDFYQFGLAAEDEARLIAERAFHLGHRRVLALSPDNSWGKRIYASFEQRWLDLGGYIAERRFYKEKKDYNPEIKALLNVDDSQQRYKAIRRIMREPVEFEPRRRQDADWVFLVALPKQGRQIRPMFDFNFAGDLPVFSTSQIFSGKQNRKKDTDLNGIQFTELPWLLESSELKTIVENNQKRAKGSYARLYAMGVDAFRLYPRLKQLAALPNSKIFGVTGDLSIDEQGKIHRKMPFAMFKRGRPVALNLDKK
ncbi:LppC family lipoprotein [Oleispira antarctica RB-8]|uniref:LppC family lipoprotein n=1 Tax=Oleispira antarctica RB-8 TaxID=698738 RepID=R4YQ46_OLEAN|nr:LppC family lipoprotein [Oleispira antarctica RB-8]